MHSCVYRCASCHSSVINTLVKSVSSSVSLVCVCVSAGKDEARGQLDSALQDVNVRYAVLEDTEKRAVCRALIEERARYCSFVSMLKPVLVSDVRARVCVLNLNQCSSC